MQRCPCPLDNAITSSALNRLAERLRTETRAEVYFDRGDAGALCDRRQPLPDRAARRRRAADGRRRGRQRSRSPPRRACRSCRAGRRPASRARRSAPAIVIDFSKYLNRIGDRRPRPDDGPGRAGRGARPAQRAPQAAGPDVRARRLDQRPGDDRRDDRQQLGRGPVAPVRQDGRPRPRRSRSSWPTAPRRRSARSPPTSSTRPAPGRTGSGRSIAWSATTVAAHREAIAAQFPQILRRVSGYNLDEFVPGLPVRPVGWREEPWQFNLARLIVGSEGTLAVVAGGRAEGRAAPAGAGAGRALVRHDPRGARPAGRDRRDRPGGRRDARPDDPRPGGAEPALFASTSNFAEGRPAAVLAAQFYADSPEELAERADDLARAVRGTAGRARRPQAPDRRRPRTTSGRSARRGSRC